MRRREGYCVQLGFAVPISGAWATPDNQLRLVRRAEELGYHSVWTLQRLLVPEHPDQRGGSAEAALRRAGRITDGWLSSSGADLKHIGASIEVVRQAAREAGRDPAAL